jgi:plastocyanin
MNRRAQMPLVIFLTVLAVAQAPHVTAADDNQNKLSVTVSFGAGLNTAGSANDHILPHTIKVKVGGVVNFAVAGFHQIFVYNPGTTPEDVMANVPPFGPPGIPVTPENLFIDYMANLYYQGLNPSGANEAQAAGANPESPLVNLFNRTNTGNRTESVTFTEPGTYLVICNVTPHFLGGMYAWVKVTGRDKDDD